MSCIFVQNGYCLNKTCPKFDKVVADGGGQHRTCETKETWEAKEGKGEFPSTATQLRTFLQSLLSLKKSSKAEQARRLAICHGCDYRRANRCTRCGCFIFKKIKKAESECPEKFW